jgi:hypothetical protein
MVCAMGTQHKFRDCDSPNCECNCLQEIRGPLPLSFEEYPEWFRLIPRQIKKRTNLKLQEKKG